MEKAIELLKKMGVDVKVFDKDDYNEVEVFNDVKAKIEDYLLKSSEKLTQKVTSEKIGVTNSYKNKIAKLFGLELSQDELKEVKFDDLLETIKEKQLEIISLETNKTKDQLSEDQKRIIADYNAIKKQLANKDKEFETLLSNKDKEWANKIESEKINSTFLSILSKNNDKLLTDSEDVALLVNAKLQREGKRLSYNQTDGLHILDTDGKLVSVNGSMAHVKDFAIIEQYAPAVIKQSNGNAGNGIHRVKVEGNAVNERAEAEYNKMIASLSE